MASWVPPMMRITRAPRRSRTPASDGLRAGRRRGPRGTRMIARKVPQEPHDADPIATLAQGSPSGHALSTTKQHASHRTDEARPPARRSTAPKVEPRSHSPVCAYVGAAGHNRPHGPAHRSDEATHRLAEARAGEPTAWFDDLYRAAGAGEAVVRGTGRSRTPCSSSGWSVRARRPRRGTRSSIGAGYGRGRRVPRVARLPHLPHSTSRRPPWSRPGLATRTATVHYDVADLLALPRGWIQRVRPRRREHERPGPARTAAAPDAIRAVSGHGRPGRDVGRHRVRGRTGRRRSADAYPGPPWPLRALRDRPPSPSTGSTWSAVERVHPDEDLRWRATFRRR
jgi:hypothetical protein